MEPGCLLCHFLDATLGKALFCSSVASVPPQLNSVTVSINIGYIIILLSKMLKFSKTSSFSLYTLLSLLNSQVVPGFRFCHGAFESEVVVKRSPTDTVQLRRPSACPQVWGEIGRSVYQAGAASVSCSCSHLTVIHKGGGRVILSPPLRCSPFPTSAPLWLNPVKRRPKQPLPGVHPKQRPGAQGGHCGCRGTPENGLFPAQAYLSTCQHTSRNILI